MTVVKPWIACLVSNNLSTRMQYVSTAINAHTGQVDLECKTFVFTGYEIS